MHADHAPAPTVREQHAAHDGGGQTDAGGCPPTLTQLVASARRGDEAAWTDIYHLLAPTVRARIRSMGLTPGVVEDAFQLTWLKLITSIDQIREPERLAAWLGVTAHNEALNLIRRDQRLLFTDAMQDHEQPGDAVDAHLDAEVAADAVHAAVAGLSDRQRAVVQLRFLTGQPATYAQIAAKLGVPTGAIGPTLGRALDRLGRHPRIVAIAG